MSDAAADMGLGCIGAACCSTGTYYDSDKNECVFGSSKTNRPSVSEGYANYMPSVSYIEVERTPCPFKPGKSSVIVDICMQVIGSPITRISSRTYKKMSSFHLN